MLGIALKSQPPFNAQLVFVVVMVVVFALLLCLC